jgi:hypothetical protein
MKKQRHTGFLIRSFFVAPVSHVLFQSESTPTIIGTRKFNINTEGTAFTEVDIVTISGVEDNVLSY